VVNFLTPFRHLGAAGPGGTVAFDEKYYIFQFLAWHSLPVDLRRTLSCDLADPGRFTANCFRRGNADAAGRRRNRRRIRALIGRRNMNGVNQ
jgi:hypothetical protein